MKYTTILSKLVDKKGHRLQRVFIRTLDGNNSESTPYLYCKKCDEFININKNLTVTGKRYTSKVKN